ncbi:MAG: sulfatase-like hydrolase/transferase [Oscillospiraceae bacterium]|nr:sulfatase-like hydrolase/transferase [Oscillospiraceae bacterium]
MARNFLWITTDHQLYYPHLQLNADQFRLKNFERICGAGSYFPNAYCPMPLCAPSRSSMITGVYPHKHGVIANTFGAGTVPAELPADLDWFHLPMQQAGYRTAWFGKWHCGNASVAADYGFEGFTTPGYGNCYTEPAYRAYADKLGLGNPKVTIEWSAKLLPVVGKTIECGKEDTTLTDAWGPFETTGHMITPKEGHEAYFLTDQACEWIKSLGKDEPFMLKLELWGPHHPYHVAAPFYGSVDPEKLRFSPSFYQNLGADMPDTYRSSVRRWSALQHNGISETEWRQIIARAYEHAMMVDDAYGRLLDLLEETGLAENTTIIFTSDHGDILGTHSGLFNKDSIMTEETVRVPLAISGESVPAGVTDSRICSTLDIVPTIYALAGLPVPASWDGMSLLGEKQRERLIVEEHGEIRIDQYQRLLVEGDMRYIAHLDEVDEFYNLAADPYQSRNLLFDVAYAESIALCRAHLLEELDAIGDTNDNAQKLRAQITHKMQTGEEYAFTQNRDRYEWM